MGFLSESAEKRLKVKTIHALCYAHFKAKRERNITPYLFNRGYELFNLRFSEKLKRLSVASYYDGHDPFVFSAETDDDLAYGEVQRLRALGLGPADSLFSGFIRERVTYIFKVLQDGFSQGLWDFTYLLEHARDTGFSFGADYCAIDEINDLNTLQWDICARATGQEVIYCGDLNQSIYGFAGVNPDYIERLQVDQITHKTLTNRVPKPIADYAMRILSRASKVYGKPMESLRAEGTVQFNDNFGDVCLKSRDMDTTVLCRTNTIMLKAKELAKGYGANIPLESQDRAISDLGEMIRNPRPNFSFNDAKALLELPAMTYFRRGAKKALAERSKEGWIPWKQFYAEYGTEELRQLLTGNRVFTREDGCGIFDPSKHALRFLTMHKAKGLEDENIVILKDSTKRIEDDDNEIRLAYVAATRAKNSLIVSELGGNVKSKLYG